MTDPERPADRTPPSAPRDPGGGDLDAAFAALRGAAPVPPRALVDRVLADADRLRPMPQPLSPPVARPVPRPARRRAPWPWLGAPVGLAAALAAGVVIGVFAPVAAPGPVATLETALFGPPLVLDFTEAADLLAD